MFKHRTANVELRVRSGPQNFVGSSFEYQWSQRAHLDMKQVVKDPDEWWLVRTVLGEGDDDV